MKSSGRLLAPLVTRQSSSWGDGVYRSDDGGQTWTHVGLSDSHHVGRIALHPADREVAFVAAMGHLWGPNEERGLYRTTDGGSNWTKLSNAGIDNGLPAGTPGRIGVSIHRADPRVVYASVEQGPRYNASTAYEERGAGVYRSADRGESWEFEVLARETGELAARAARLEDEASGVVAPLTSDQQSQLEFVQEMLVEREAEVEAALSGSG